MNIPTLYPSINQRRRKNESEKMKSIMAARRQIEIIQELQQAGLDIGDLDDESLPITLGGVTSENEKNLTLSRQ